MSYLLFLIVFLVLLILYRLLTTNHWTTGKKILVGLMGSLAWKYLFYLQPFMILSPAMVVLVCEVPLLLVLLITTFLFYFNEE